MADFWRRHRRDERSGRRILLQIDRKLDRMSEAIEALTAAVAELEADETAAAAEFSTLATEIGELKVGEISEAEVDSLAEKAAAVAAALKAATPSGTE